MGVTVSVGISAACLCCCCCWVEGQPQDAQTVQVGEGQQGAVRREAAGRDEVRATGLHLGDQLGGRIGGG